VTTSILQPATSSLRHRVVPPTGLGGRLPQGLFADATQVDIDCGRSDRGRRKKKGAIVAGRKEKVGGAVMMWQV